MLSTVFLCNVALLLPPSAEPVDGLKVTAVEIVDLRRAKLKPAKPSENQHFSFDRPGLKLVVEVQGEDAARASHYGMLEIESATDNTGAKLKLNEDAFGFHDSRTEFVEIDRSQMFFGEDDAPKDLIRVELPFESPARSAATISVRGKLDLKKVATVDVLVPTTVGELANEDAKKAGLKIKIVKPDDEKSFSYEVSGKLDALFNAAIVDADGKPVETNGGSSFGGGDTSHRVIYLEEPMPENAKLRLSIVTKAEIVPAKFDLKDVKLP